MLNRRDMMSSTALVLISAGATQAQAQTPPDTEWRHYANDLGSTRYSPLDQINAGNFNKLEVAWRFPTAMLGSRPEYTWEATPLLIKGRIYSTAGARRDVVCLDGATGELLWIFRKDEGERARNAPRQYSGRGLAYWTDGSEERILFVTTGYQLVALDAKTGLPAPGFGENGVVDLKLNMDQVIDPLGGEDRPACHPDRGQECRDRGCRPCLGQRAGQQAAHQGLCAWLRCEDRQAALDLPHHSAQGRVRLRQLDPGRRGREGHQHRLLGADLG